MKSLTRTMIVLVIFNLVVGSFALAQAEGLAEPTVRRAAPVSAPPEPTQPRTAPPVPTPVEPTPPALPAPMGTRTFIISGRTGLSGVMLKGLPGNPVTGWPGTYKDTLEYGWSGTVTPVREGYTFEPSSRTYSKVTKNYYSQDYTAKMITFTISGTTGIGGVVMIGLPGNLVSDERGYYSATVNYNWTGTVTPAKEGYTIEPASVPYTQLIRSYTNHNYTVTPITFTISGEAGVGGAVMKGLPGNPVTSKDGTYKAGIIYGWSGTVTPTKKGYSFEPPEQRYTKIIRDLTNHNYSPKRIAPAPILGRTGGRKVLVIPATDVKAEDLVEITQDLLVMSHILDERFREPRTIKGVFTDFGDFFGRNNRSTETIYMQGYGVVFLMEVNFAFSPPLISEEQKDEETAEHIDPTWQRARQQIFAPKTPMPGFSEQGPGLVKFDQLKKELIETLKHAANIRNLKPDEWIILTVIGHGRQSGEFHEDYYRSAAPRSRTSRDRRSSRGEAEVGAYGGGMVGGMSMGMGGMGGMAGGGYAGSSAGGYGGGMMGGMGGYGGGMGGYGGGMGGFGGGMMGGMAGYGEMSLPSATVLTIRAKKTDVDDFAKDELDFEEFQQTLEIFTY